MHDVPMVENVPLARALARESQIGKAIKPKLFKPVAEILTYPLIQAVRLA